ncbi:MAG: 30S ribosomal protein S17 [Candidatus Sericytochromatia bacterium]
MPKKILSGSVVSDKMDKTGVIAITTVKQHNLYSKNLKRTQKYKFHDENNECKVGDLVEIEESRPYSKDKKWRLVRILKKAGDSI